MIDDDFPICELWLGMIMAHQQIENTWLVACTESHLNPADRNNPARCPLPGCRAYSRTLTRAESAELGSVASLGDYRAARAYCKHLASRGSALTKEKPK